MKGKISKIVSKPRNYVTMAMIRSGKGSGAHQKNHKQEIMERIQEESFEELYDEYDDGSY